MLARYQLQFNVAQLLKEATGAARHYDLNAELDPEFDENLVAVSPLTGYLDLLRTGRDILVTGRLATSLQKTCGRCLTEFTTPVSIELAEEFYPSLDILTGTPLPKDPEVESENYIDDQNILDMVEVVRQELVVAADALLYCRPDCKGLCPHCGQDRNVVACTCHEERADPRWAGLQALQTEE
jgi:uncharacterized protein